MNHVFIDSGVIQDWSVVAPRKKKWNLTKKKKRASHREAACSSSIMFSASEPARTNPVSVSASASSHWTTWPRTWWQSWMSLAAQLQGWRHLFAAGRSVRAALYALPSWSPPPSGAAAVRGKKKRLLRRVSPKRQRTGTWTHHSEDPICFSLVLFCLIFFRGEAALGVQAGGASIRAERKAQTQLRCWEHPDLEDERWGGGTGRWGASLTMVRHTICTCETLHVTYQGAEVVEERRGEERRGEERRGGRVATDFGYRTGQKVSGTSFTTFKKTTIPFSGWLTKYFSLWHVDMIKNCSRISAVMLNIVE